MHFNTQKNISCILGDVDILLFKLDNLSLQDFEKNKLDACNSTLGKLIRTRGNDPKVMHNNAVVAYYKSGLRRTDEFKKVLEDVCAKVCLIY